MKDCAVAVISDKHLNGKYTVKIVVCTETRAMRIADRLRQVTFSRIVRWFLMDPM